MNSRDLITPRQLMTTALVCVLSPLIRRFPRDAAATAGRTAWLSAPMALVPAALVILIVWLLFRQRSEPTAFSTVLCDALGKIPGRAVMTLYALWLVFYAGFLLRSGAERFVTTVYPDAGFTVFIVAGALLVGIAALGSVRSIVRAAMIFCPLLIAVPFGASLLMLGDIDWAILVPVTAADLPTNGYAALQIANVISVLFFLSFLGNRLTEPLRPRNFLWRLPLLLVLLGAMTVCCLGLFGPELTAKLRYPFFLLLRDLHALGPLERAEPVVIALWVFSDFVLLSLLLRIAADNLRICFGCPVEHSVPQAGFSLRRGRWLTVLVTLCAVTVGLTIAPDTTRFVFFSEQVVPPANTLMTFAIPLLVLLIGALRRKV